MTGMRAGRRLFAGQTMRYLLALALCCALTSPARAEPAAGTPLVVIDPGHGGKKDGAFGPKGDREKDIALALAKQLKAELLKAMPSRVLLTRERDEHMELKDRIRLANEAGADLFVSVHCNSMPEGPLRSRARGIETYFLSAEATGKEAERVAAQENGEADDAGPMTGDLAMILNDLAQTQAHRDASALAYAVQARLVKDLKAKNRGVHQAPFVVLMGAQMPAVLVEVGYLSHPDEAKKLITAAHQERIAKSLASGIKGFLAERATASR